MLTADPARLLHLSRSVRRTAGALLVEASAVDARDGYPTPGAADLAVSAMEAEQAAQHLACAAQDTGLQEFLRMRAAGFRTAYHPVRALGAVVVGDDHAGAGPDHSAAKPGIWARATAAGLRLVRKRAA